jgi:hypothetical protein
MLVMMPVVPAHIQMLGAAETCTVCNLTVEGLRIGLVATKSIELVEEVDTATAGAPGIEHAVEVD